MEKCNDSHGYSELDVQFQNVLHYSHCKVIVDLQCQNKS